MDVVDVRIRASKKFSPKQLCSQLIRANDGTAIVDKHKAVRSEEDKRLFIIIMNMDYGWNYSDYQDSTVYFEADNGIVGGIYNTRLHTRVTRRKVAIPVNLAEGLTRQYVYSQTTIKEMCDAIKGT